MAEWDLVVIGGGAAGLSAAAAAAGLGLSCLVIDRMGGGGELMNLGPLHGLDEGLTGPDLAARLIEAAVIAGAELGIADVTAVRPDGDRWRITTDDGSHRARAVILAVGLAPGTLGLGNENAFEGRGLSHCAACDGPLYGGQPVVVAGNDRWAWQEARDLAETSSRVTLVGDGLRQPDADNIVVISGRIIALEGEAGLTGVQVQPDHGAAAIHLPAKAIFVQTGRLPALDFAPGTLALDADGRIVTDGAGQCSLPGLYAAGDARAGQPRDAGTAMNDGRNAAAAVHLALCPLGKSPE